MGEAQLWKVCGLGPGQGKVSALVINLEIAIRGQDEVSKGATTEIIGPRTWD